MHLISRLKPLIAGSRPLRRLAARYRGSPNSVPVDLKGNYVALVDQLKGRLPLGEAMMRGVGGDFEAQGAVQCDLVKHYGLRRDGYLIDVGCGSGRLAKPLSEYLAGSYLGIDVVPDLLTYARTLVNREDWQFREIDYIEIPERSGRADMVCFFSVLTHLLHEHSYWYLDEAKRVLKPGGKILFSFLEFTQSEHWSVFMETVQAAQLSQSHPLSVFIDRSAIPIWAQSLGLHVDEIRGGGDSIVPSGALGQSLCVLTRP